MCLIKYRGKDKSKKERRRSLSSLESFSQSSSDSYERRKRRDRKKRKLRNKFFRRSRSPNDDPLAHYKRQFANNYSKSLFYSNSLTSA